ncbi:MAG TPA: short-chain dehydrogenase [Bacteroidales bacterium]|nr:short-chain dehydrogenase [Bacteroidales bacterium]
MEKWNIDNIPGQDNKIVIITGANSGIGFQTARILSSKGAKVIMACRNKQKAEKATGKILRRFNKADLEFMHLDLSSLDSVKKFAEEYKAKYKKLDVLINNAGVLGTPYKKTEDGFEWQFGVNHLGHFALTGSLLDLLLRTPGSRVVTITSIAHFRAVIHFEDLSGRSWYSPMKSYRQSKLANLLFAYELQRNLNEKNADSISIAAHPGISATNIVWLPFPVNKLKDLVLMRAYRGAMPGIMAATDSDLRGGEYIGPSGRWQSFGYPEILKSSVASYDRTLWKRLWEVSEELTGIIFF